MINDTWLLGLCVFGSLTILGVTSGLTNERLWVSEPLACMLLGIVSDPSASTCCAWTCRMIRLAPVCCARLRGLRWPLQ